MKRITLTRTGFREWRETKLTFKPPVQIPPWSPLGAALVAIHIADASDTRKGRKGWAVPAGAGKGE